MNYLCPNRKFFLSFLLLLYGAWIPALSAQTQYRFSNLNGSRQITFYSKTSKEGFEGVANEINGMATVDFSKRNLGLKGSITIPVMSLTTGITLRDVHMRGRDWLNENYYPNIKFDMNDPSKHIVKKKGKNKWFVKAAGNFTCKGKTKKILIPLTITRKTTKKGEFVHIKGSFKVHLADHRIRGPLAMRMIGAKVSPDIKVSLKLVGEAVATQTNKKYSW